jgi:hypothetical protein
MLDFFIFLVIFTQITRASTRYNFLRRHLEVKVIVRVQRYPVRDLKQACKMSDIKS